MDDRDRIPGPFVSSEWTPYSPPGPITGGETPRPHAVLKCSVDQVPAFPSVPTPISPVALMLGTETHYLSVRMTREGARELARQLLKAIEP